MFDLPVVTKSQRRAATRFRDALLDLGFSMAQFSVYMRHCKDRMEAETFIRKISKGLPAEGSVHMLVITDKQYESIRTFHCGVSKRLKNPDQLMLF